MNMSKEEVTAIMSLAKKILQHQSDKEWLQDLQDESVDTPNEKTGADKDGDNDLKVLRKSEDSHDTFVQQRVGNCECHND